MGHNFIDFFSWVDIHGIYYIVKFSNQIWWFVFFIKHTKFLTSMMQNWTKKITTENEDDK